MDIYELLVPTITIATVTYNAERTLQRTLDSVAEQTYPYIEHLIIDGCSTDKTTELIHRYVDANTTKNQYDIVFIRERDKGLYDAMNKALEHATGDFIIFLNAGDRLHSAETLWKIFDMRANKAAAIIYGETDIVDDAGKFIRHRRLEAPMELDWRSFREGMLVCHQSFYVNTDFAREELYDLRYRYSADFDWCIRLMKKAERLNLPIQNSWEVLTDYLNEGVTTRHHRASLWERFRIMTRHYGLFTTLAEHLWFVIRALVIK